MGDVDYKSVSEEQLIRRARNSNLLCSLEVNSSA